MPRQIVPVSDVASILLTQDEGDLRYMPITYTPPPVDLSGYYTKTQADARYEPIDTMYTKGESDARYALLAHLHTGTYLPVSHEPGTDPHPQYLNQTRGDARYSQTAHLHTATYVDAIGDTMTGGLIVTPAAKSDQALTLNGQATIRATGQNWHPDWGALEIGRVGIIRADDSATAVTLAIQANGLYGGDGVGRAKVAGGSTMHVMSTSQWVFYTAASVGAGATQNYLPRMTMGLGGTMSLTPDTASTYGIILPLNSAQAILLQSGGGIQMQDAANNYGMGFRMRGSPVVLDVTYLGNNTGAYFDTVGNAKVNSLTVDGVESIQNASGGMRLYHRDNFGLYHELYASGSTLRFYESGYGDAMTLNRVGGGLLVFNPEGTGATVRLGSAYSKAGTYSSSNYALQAEGVLQLYSLGSNIHLQCGGGVMHPLTDNVLMLGYPSYRFTSVHAVNGSIQTSHVSSKRNIAPLDPDACVAAVLDTDWVSYEYMAPALQMPPEGKTETFEERKQRLLNHQKMVEDTANSRKQNGYVLGSPDFKVSDLFGLPDRESASDHADLGILACALQAALKRIAALEGAAV